MPAAAQLRIIDRLVRDLVATRAQVEALSKDIDTVADGSDATDSPFFLLGNSKGRKRKGEVSAEVRPEDMAELLKTVSSVCRYQAHVRELHDTYAERQVESLPQAFTQMALDGELRVQLGANDEHAMPGWISVGVDPGDGSESCPVIETAITTSNTRIPLPAASCAYVYASHFLEHLAYPDLVDAALSEVRRVLRPGGVLRVVVPDAEEWLKAHVASRYSHEKSGEQFGGPFWDDVRRTWSWWDLGSSNPFARSELGVVAWYLGSGGGVTATLTSQHQMPFDAALLHATLSAAGFIDIERSSFNGSLHGPLAEIDSFSSVAEASYTKADGTEQPLSLFVDAKVPQ